MSSPETVRPPPWNPPVWWVTRADPDGAEEVGDLLVEGDVLGAAEHHQRVGQPEQGPGFVLAEDARSAGRGSARPR